MSLVGPPSRRPISLDSLLEQGLRTKSDAPALVSAQSQMSWRQLSDSSDRLAAHYLARGLQPGDRVASLMPNCPALMVHYLACLRAGLVATPLNYRYVAAEIDHALRVSGASLLVHHVERDRCVADCPTIRRLPSGVIRRGTEDGLGRPDDKGVERSSRVAALPTLEPDAPAFIYFTSGSTGRPKGVTHTRQTYAAMMAAVMQGMELVETDRLLPASSMSHIGGSLFGLSALAAGGQLIIPCGSGGTEVLTLLRGLRPTVLWMLPAALLALVEDHEAVAADVRSIRLCVSGGDRVAGSLERRFTDLAGFPIDESYGMTEIGLTMINPPAGENRIGSVGRLCPGYELSLRDEDGVEVPIGSPGRVWIRSPTNMVGYWDDASATQQALVDGWLDTGDVMRVDAEGYAWFCGRKKQIIIHDGSNICPEEVEAAIADHPAVEAVGVIGVHDLVHGENVRAYVRLRDGEPRPTREQIIRLARDRVGYKAPEEIVFLDEMPHNASGKVDRLALKQMAEARTTG